MRYLVIRLLGAGAIAISLIAACSSGYRDLTDTFSGVAEVKRLRFFKEVRADKTLKERKLTGNGVRVTIMGEMADATHPDLQQSLHRQFNAFARPGDILPGVGNAPYRAELLRKGDGHGTHIAGTIAAACDGIGIQGLACGARMDVYDIGAYDGSERFRETGPSDNESEMINDFLTAFRVAIEDVTRRNQSKITTGSFNIEAPAVQFPRARSLSRTELASAITQIEDSPESILTSDLFAGVSQADKTMVQDAVHRNEGDLSIAAMALIPTLEEFHRLSEAIGAYQKSGGVYIVTESNYSFGKNTSALNALPTLSDNVDPSLWISVVMVQPEGIEIFTSLEELGELGSGTYIAPLNGCGTTARDYCLVTPSYQVLSTMTERVAERGVPVYHLDGRSYQVFSGHSMGAPMVASALALMQEFNTRRGLGLPMRRLVEILKDSANRDFDGYDPIRHGRGMLDIDAAIAQMARI